MDRGECRICLHKENLEPYLAKDYFLGTKKEYKYLLCPECGSLSLEDIPHNLGELYSSYYSFTSPSKLTFLRKLFYRVLLTAPRLTKKALCKVLNKQEDLPILSIAKLNLKKSSRILDVGCGSGTLLLQLHDLGYKNSLGIDPFLEKDIRYPNGLAIRKLDYFEIEDKYDLIMFHHVFEHFPDLGDALRHLKKILSDEGMCIIRIPDVNSFSFHKFKDRWFSIHAPFHISLPSRKGMELLLQNTGMTLVERVGEQLAEFFFYSMGHKLGIADYERYGNRKFIERYGLRKIPPFHVRSELEQAKQRMRQVKKYDLCDWSAYYLKKQVNS